MDAEIDREVFTTKAPDLLIGNSQAELRSMLTLVWVAAQSLSLRQKYAYFLQYRDFIVAFVTADCCSIKELAEFFEVTQEELAPIVDALPFKMENLNRLMGEKLGEKITPKQIWEARSKGRAKLANSLKTIFINERLFVRKRT